MKNLLVLTYGKRRSFFIVEGTETDEIVSALSKLDAVGNNINNIRGSSNLFYLRF